MTSRYPGGVVRKNQLTPTASAASGVWTMDQAAQATKSDIWPYGNIANPISQSLRFRSGVSAYLSRTPASAGNRRTFTISKWIKRGLLGVQQQVFTVANTGANYYFYVRFLASDVLEVFDYNAGSGTYLWQLQTTQVFRDPAAYYHIQIAIDTTQATASNRVKVYINGTQVTAFAVANYPTQNFDTQYNYNGQSWIGSYLGTTNYLDGYLTEINSIDGQQLDPSYFGQTSAITGIWEPKQYSGTYGTNGFHLEFKDTTVGKDTSGNNNHWTQTNISTTLDPSYDLVTDVPVQWTPRNTLTDIGGVVRGNYCTLNPLNTDSNISLLNANMAATWTGNSNKDTLATIAPTSGKFYCEVYQSNGATTDVVTGFSLVTYNRNSANLVGDSSSQFLGYTYAGRKWDKGTQTNGLTTLTVSTDYLCFAIDYDAGKAWAGKNGVWFSSGDPSTGTNPFWTFTANSQYVFGGPIYNGTFSVNFGQRQFAYTPPTGFKSLCTTNLSTPTIGATTATAANKYFDATLYTGTGATATITNTGGFQPDFVWLKSRSAATNNQLFDSVRGPTNVLVSNSSEIESLSANTITSFNSNGFTIGTNTAINTSTATYVGWQWKGQGSNTTNTSGSITSTVNVNQAAGFSIVTYTGTGANATVGHALTSAPKMIFVKVRSAVTDWIVWHTALAGTEYLALNLTNAKYTASPTIWNSTTPTSSVFSIGTSEASNKSSNTHVAYCWTEIDGFSKIGSYVGNGSTGGPFVYCGFKPKFLLIKNTASTSNWNLWDSSRKGYNSTDTFLNPDTANADTVFQSDVDFLSNGFKLRTSWANLNTNGSTYIFMAFAETPFKTALAR